MSALWRISLMLVLNRLLLNRVYVVINALNALASIIFMCDLHVIFLSNITPGYFTLFTNGIFRLFRVRRDSGGLIRETRNRSCFSLYGLSTDPQETTFPTVLLRFAWLSVGPRNEHHCSVVVCELLPS
jgi:hypothetical protein